MQTRERAQTLPAPPATANPSPTAAAAPPPRTAAVTSPQATAPTSSLRRSASDASTVAPSSPPTSPRPLPSSSSGIMPPLKSVRASSDSPPAASAGKRRTLARMLPTKGSNTTSAAATTADVDNNSDDAEHWSDERVEWAGITYSLDGLPPFDSDCPNAVRAAMEPAPGSADPTMRAYNPTHCLWLAMAAALAYRSSAQIKHVVTRIWRWDEAEFFEDVETDTQGFGMYNHQAIIVSFRGTVGKQNWLTNLDYCPTEPFPTLKGVKVHNGFNSALMSVFEDVRRFILKARANNPTLPLYLGGHSLGGALANMLLAYLSMPSCMATCPLYKPPTKKDRKKSKANLRAASDMDMVQKKEEKTAVKESTGGSAIVGGAGERKAGRFRSLISRGGGKAKEAAPDSNSSDSDNDDVSSTPRGSVGDDELRPQLPHHSQSVPNMVLSDDDGDDDVSDGDDGLSLSAPVKRTTGAPPAATSAHVSIASSSRPKHHPHSDPLLSAKENEKRAKKARKELKEKQKEEEQQKKKATKAAKAASKAQLPTSPRKSAGQADGEANKGSTLANAKQRQSFVEQRVLKRGHTACDLSLLMPARPTAAAAAAAADSTAATDAAAASATTDDSALPSAAAAEPTAEATAAPSITDVAATSSSTPSSSAEPTTSSVHADGWHSTSAPVVPTKPPLSPPLPAAAAVVAAMGEATTCEATTCDITSLVTASSAVAASHLQPMPFVPIAVAGVYTFGQPKVGNDEFVYELKRHAPSTGFYRVTHNNDVVPSLPRKGYAHCGRRIFVSQDGLLIQGEGVAREVRELNRGGVGAIRRTKRGLMDHLMRAYLDQVVNHYRLNEPDLVSPCSSPASLRGALRGLLEVEQTVLRAEDAGFAPESVEDFMAALRGFSVADAIHTDNLGKTKKATVKEAKKKATESIKLIKKKEKALRRRSQNLEDAIEPAAVAVRPTHRRTKSTGTSGVGFIRGSADTTSKADLV
ncbi:lipase [Acanthamoeba castellanii str. Neff]|uniref:Lipase n=1 Tax=Acanthamoeba castellanii (strain ATCC 30010 / Neff) TaxID=1257118 RepID=L8GYR8_ACACF|nr:lipase [Acanthamoeba castellanii str. Neff]ELR17266.1 lipase [Acanthamoeba castellanii str. Neff]